MQVDSDPEDNAQSILEDHMSRIWDSSAGPTPSRSPGLRTPDRNRHRHVYPSPSVSGVNIANGLSLLPPKSVLAPMKRRDDGGSSLLPATSATPYIVGRDDKMMPSQVSVTMHGDGMHRHGHRHHQFPSSTKDPRYFTQDLDAVTHQAVASRTHTRPTAQRISLDGPPTVVNHVESGGSDTRRPATRKSSDVYIDVSTVAPMGTTRDQSSAGIHLPVGSHDR